MVKVIQSNDESVRDAIIRSTNNQTAVDAASLYATDKAQRDIEDVLKSHGLWYERRKNYYANRGKRRADIITPFYLGSAYIALGLKSPVKAKSFNSGSLRQSRIYELVLGHCSHLQIWVNVVAIMKMVERALGEVARHHESSSRIVRTWRYVVAFVFMVRTFGSFSYSRNLLVSMEIGSLNESLLRDTVKKIWKFRSNRRRVKHWSNVEVQSLLAWIASECKIEDLSDWRPVSWPGRRSSCRW